MDDGRRERGMQLDTSATHVLKSLKNNAPIKAGCREVRLERRAFYVFHKHIKLIALTANVQNLRKVGEPSS